MHDLLHILSAHVTVNLYCLTRLYTSFTITILLTVELVAPPTITKQPASANIQALQEATFTCKASGFEVKYEWKRHSSNRVIGRQSSLTISRATPLDEDQYYCVAMTEGGYAFSNNVTLTVNG